MADTSVNLKAISELVRSFSGQGSARPSDDSPLPRGPWDPIVRTAMASARASSAEARLAFLATITGNAALWELVGGWGSRLAAVALNPQPLPPLESALNPEPLPPRHQVLTAMAEAVIDRAELLGTVASGQEEQRGIIIVSGYVDKLADDFCGTGFKLPFPGHGPRPPWWGAEVTAADLLVMAAQFHRASEELPDAALKSSFAKTANKFAEAGMRRM